MTSTDDHPGDVGLPTARTLVRFPGPGNPFLPGPWSDLVVVHRAERSELGRVGVRVEPEEPTIEVRVTMHGHATRQGYGTEALDAVVTHALVARGFVRVVAFADAHDDPRRRLFARVGLLPVAADGDDLVYVRRAATGP